LSVDGTLWLCKLLNIFNRVAIDVFFALHRAPFEHLNLDRNRCEIPLLSGDAPRLSIYPINLINLLNQST
jgi:hypothetical protein